MDIFFLPDHLYTSERHWVAEEEARDKSKVMANVPSEDMRAGGSRLQVKGLITVSYNCSAQDRLWDFNGGEGTQPYFVPYRFQLPYSSLEVSMPSWFATASLEFFLDCCLETANRPPLLTRDKCADFSSMPWQYEWPQDKRMGAHRAKRGGVPFSGSLGPLF